MRTFASLSLDCIPRPAETFYARGLFAPLMKSANHILFALAATASTPPLVTPEEVLNELHEAKTHLDPQYFYSPADLSNTATNRINLYQELLDAAILEANITPINNTRLRILADAAASLISFLDWEIGIPYSYSDAGTSL